MTTPPRRAGFGLFVLLAGCLLASRPAEAQSILSRVVSADGQAPLSGVIVTLIDGQGQTVQRLLTGTAGSVTFRNAATGPYRLRAEMIGRETTLSQPFEVTDEGTVRTIELPNRPVELSGLAVDGKRVCSLDIETALAPYTVWGEARKALQAAQITQQQSLYRFQVVTSARVLRANTRIPVGERLDTIVIQGRDPFIALSPEELERGGYARSVRLDWELFGPNTDIFLAPGFERTHCFSLRRDGNRKGQVGLHFAVAPGRSVADIEGTLWLDEASSELRSLEFRFVHLDDWLVPGPHGGSMDYQRLDGGSWAIRKWNLYSPQLDLTAEIMKVQRISGPK